MYKHDIYIYIWMFYYKINLKTIREWMNVKCSEVNGDEWDSSTKLATA